jgi:hypothetical protein
MDGGTTVAFLLGLGFGAFGAWCWASYIVASGLRPDASAHARARIGL